MVTNRLLTPTTIVTLNIYQPFLIATIITTGLLIAWLPLEVIAILLVGGLSLILILRTPILSMYLLILIIPFSGLLAVSLEGGFKIGLMEIVLALGVIAWLLQLATRQIKTGQAGIAKIWLLPFLLFIAITGISWLNALSISASLIETIKWIEMLALYLLITALLPPKHIKWVVAVVLLAGSIQALLGFYQFIFKVGPPGFLLFGGRFLRAYGSFAQPNPYAGYLGLILPLAFSLTLWAFSDYNRAEFDNLKSKIYIILAGLLFVAMLASQSRGALLGFIAAAGVILMLHSKKIATLLVALVMIVATVILAGTFSLGTLKIGTESSLTAYNAIIQRMAEGVAVVSISDISTVRLTSSNFAILERLAHWQAAREMWRDNLWLGTGFGNYASAYPAYAPGRWLDPLGHAHNYLLNIGAETGLIGITVYLLFWGYIFVVTLKVILRSDGFDRAVALGCMGILTHLHVHNMFDNLYVHGMYLHIAIILALIAILYKKTNSGFKITQSSQILRTPANS